MWINKSITLLLTIISLSLYAQDTVRYTDQILSNVDYHHGRLMPAVGVHAIQVMRASREHPALADHFGWTYNHAPMLAYWHNKFYLEYLSDSVGEHIPPGQTLIVTSTDGYHWQKPEVIFPVYAVPDGTTKPGHPGVAEDLTAVMHQRMGFYVSKDNRLLALAYYALVLDAHDDPNDGKGIGRVVREIKKDGSFGPIYFIRHNKSWAGNESAYPHYTKSKDKGFVKACQELLNTPLMMQQWVEEADRDDPLIPLQQQYKAFSYYHIPDGRVVGLWKHALTSVSKDHGKTWTYMPTRAPGFVNSNAKIWGQRTADGRYVTVYNPSEFRWPLALSLSDDGLTYHNLLLVHGEITPMRYGGNYKSYGPQYVRGIIEGNGTPPDGKLWVTYSVNKEDIWVASISVPIRDSVSTPINDVFNELPAGHELDRWNLYSPAWAPAQLEARAGAKYLALKDHDPFDYARAERIFPTTTQGHVTFTVTPAQTDHGKLVVELQDKHNYAALRLTFDSAGYLHTKAGYRDKNIVAYKAHEPCTVSIQFNTDTRFYTVTVNGEEKGRYLFFAPVAALTKIVFQTGNRRYYPTADTPTDQMYDLKDTGAIAPEAAFYLQAVHTSSLKATVESGK